MPEPKDFEDLLHTMIRKKRRAFNQRAVDAGIITMPQARRLNELFERELAAQIEAEQKEKEDGT